ncbi:unnamed protein product, partial [Mesorhabditis spiculigera]
MALGLGMSLLAALGPAFALLYVLNQLYPESPSFTSSSEIPYLILYTILAPTHLVVSWIFVMAYSDLALPFVMRSLEVLASHHVQHHPHEHVQPSKDSHDENQNQIKN